MSTIPTTGPISEALQASEDLFQSFLFAPLYAVAVIISSHRIRSPPPWLLPRLDTQKANMYTRKHQPAYLFSVSHPLRSPVGYLTMAPTLGPIPKKLPKLLPTFSDNYIWWWRHMEPCDLNSDPWI